MTITLDKETEKLIADTPEIAENLGEFVKQQAILMYLRSKKSPEALEIVKEAKRLAAAETRSRDEVFEDLMKDFDEIGKENFQDSKNDN